MFLQKQIVKFLGFAFQRISLFLVLLVLLLTGVFSYTRVATPTQVYAATSSNLNFQARLLTSSGNVVPDGYYNLEFKIFNASVPDGGETPLQGACTTDPGAVADEDCLWTETRDFPGVDDRVRTVNGYFSVNLGSVNSLPTNINWDQNMWLSMRVGGSSTSPAWDAEMSPRIKLTSVPFAQAAGQLQQDQGTYRGQLNFSTLTTENQTYRLPDSSLAYNSNGGATVCVFNGTASNCPAATGSAFYIQNTGGSGTPQAAANFNIQATNSTTSGTIGGIIRGAAGGQTVDLFQLQASDGTILTSFQADGKLVFGPSGFQDTNLFREGANVLRTNDALTVDGLITGSLGATISGATININASSNFATNINTGTSTGVVSIGNTSNVNNATNIQGGTTGGINLGSVGATTTGSTIHIADTTDATAAQIVTIGSSAANAGNISTLQGGTAASAVILRTGATAGAAGGIVIGNTTGANTQTISIGTNATASSATTVNIGSTVAGITTLQSLGGVAITTLIAADTDSYSVCRDLSSKLLTSCDANNTTGVAFLNGLNSFTGTATLGTNSTGNGALQIQTSGVARALFAASSNNLYFGNADSTGVNTAPSAFTLNGTTSSNVANAGGALTVIGGAGASTTTGSAGGAVTVQGGTAGGSNANNGGALSFTGGTASATGAGGAINVLTGAGGATSGASGALSLQSGATTNGTSGLVTLQSGNATTGTAGDVAIDVGTSSTGAPAINIGTSTNSTAKTITIGGSNGLGNITLGSSSAAQSVLIANGAGAPTVSIANASVAGVTLSIAGANNTSANTISIANGASAANTTVSILSGVGTAGAGTLNLGNNTRVTTIDIGNIAAAAARTINLGTGSNTVGIDTLNIGTGNTTVAGGKTINIGNGTPTGAGTNLVSIGSTANASTLTLQGGTGATAIALTTGANAGAAGGIVIGNTTGANTQTISIGTNATASSATTVTVGSLIGASLTNIQGGTGNATGDINIGDTTVAGKIIDIGSVTNAATSTIRIATAAAVQTVTIGSTNTTSKTTISGGSGVSSGIVLNVDGGANNQGTVVRSTTTDSTGAFQVQNAAGTAFLNADTTINQLSVRTAAETLGSELAPTPNNFNTAWTGATWTRIAGSATHVSGSADDLAPSTPLTVTANSLYKVIYTIAGRTTGDVLVFIGGGCGVTCANDITNGTFTKYITSIDTSNLLFTPSSDFNGTISAVSVKRVTAVPSAPLVVKNSDGTTALEVRGNSASGLLGNVFIGLNSGANNIGNYNIGLGLEALQNNTTGAANNAIGYQSLQFNTTGTGNNAQGFSSLAVNTTGSANTAIGGAALGNNTTGSYNVGLGYGAGVDVLIGVSSNVTGSNNTFVGALTAFGSPTQLLNSTAIGTNATVSRSDTLVLGCVAGANGCTATTSVGIGVADPTARFQVNSDVITVTGTIDVAGTAVTGTGTSFTTQLSVGDTLISDIYGEARRITAIADNTNLTVGSSYSQSYTGSTFTATKPIFSLSTSGATTFKNSANSTSAFLIQNAAPPTTASSTNVLAVDTTNNRIGINLNVLAGAVPSADLSFGTIAAGSSRIINVLTQTTSNTNGGDLTVNSAAGNGTGAGGVLTLQAGTGGATGAGGAAVVRGGTGGGTSGAGGAATLQGGTAVGAFAGGTAAVLGGTAASTAGSNGGAVAITGAAGTSTGVGGTGGAVTIQAGAGAGSNANVGGAVNLTAGSGSATGAGGGIAILTGAGGATSGASGALSLQSGATTNGNSGLVTLQSGSAATGTAGNVAIDVGTSSTGTPTITIGTSTNTPAKTISIGGSNGTGQITLGSSSAAQIVAIGNGTGANTVNIANNVAAATGNTVSIAGGATATGTTDTISIGTGNSVTTGSKVVNIATGTPGTGGTNTVAIGTGGTTTGTVGVTVGSNGAANHTLLLQGGNVNTAGSEALRLQTAAAGGIAIGTAAQTGTITLGQSTAGQIINIGGAQVATGNTQTIHIGDSATGTGKDVITIGSTNDASSLALQAGTGNITLLGSGTSNTGTVVTVSNNSTAAFKIQSASAADVLFKADTSGNIIKVGNDTGTTTATTQLVLDNATTAPSSNGSGINGAMYYDSTLGRIQCYQSGKWGRCSASDQLINLVPEYSGATMTGDGSNNTGTMTSDFCSKGNTNPPDINVTACPTNGDQHNYYSWTSQATNDYDIWVRYQLPSDFGGFVSSTSIQMYGWRTSSTESATLSMYSGGSLCGTATNVATGTATWTQTALGGDETACSLTAGSIVTFRIQLSVGTNNNFARAGEISFDYKSK